MGLLTTFFGPATADPNAALLGSAYNPEAERAARFSSMLSGMGDAILNPQRHLGDIGQIGRAIGAGHEGWKSGGTSYLQEAMARKLNADKLERTKREQEEWDRQDAAKADFIAAHPEYRQFIEMYPKEFGEFWQKKMLGEENLLPGQKGEASTPRAGTTPQKRWNPDTQKYEDWLVFNDGTARKMDASGTEAVGPGEATVRGKQAGDFIEQQNAAHTTVQNIHEAAGNIEQLRETLAASPELTTSWRGVAFAQLPGTQAMKVRGMIEQLEANAFFSNIAQMQGYGALSNAEGAKVAAAKSRVRQALTYEDLVDAIDDYERVLNSAYDRNQKIIETGDWGQMDEVRKQSSKEMGKFKKSRTPPFPTDGSIAQEDWDLLTPQEKRDFYDAGGMPY